MGAHPSRSSRPLRGVLACLAVVVALVVTCVALAQPRAVPGTAHPFDAGAAGRVALDRLAGLTDTALHGVVGTGAGQELTVDVVVTGDGGATAVVDNGRGGTAEIVVAPEGSTIKGNQRWWLDVAPGLAATYADTWVQADATVGFPVEALRGLAGARLAGTIGSGTTGRTWSSDRTDFDGEPALALTADGTDWTLYVSATDPSELLGFGGPVVARGPSRFAAAPAQTAAPAGAYPYVRFSTAAPDPDCTRRSQERRTEIGRQAPAAPPPALPSPPGIAVVGIPQPLCSAPMCQLQWTVTNTGGQPVTGTALLTGTGAAPLTVPIVLAPGASTVVTLPMPNQAPRGRTVSVSGNASVEVTAFAGPDLDAARRLRERGIDPEQPLPQVRGGYGPEVTRTFDRLTTPPPVVGLRSFAATAAQPPPPGDVAAAVRALVGDAIQKRYFSMVDALVASPALRVTPGAPHPLVALAADLASADPETAAAALRTLERTYRLADGRPTPAGDGSLEMRTGAVVDHQERRVHLIAAVAGPPAGADDSTERMLRAVRRLADGFAAAAPAGYTRVAEVHVERGTGNAHGADRAGVVKALGGRPVDGSLLDLGDASGQRLLDELVVVNGSSPDGGFAFGPEDVDALVGTPRPDPPAAPPADVRHTGPNVEHSLEGDLGAGGQGAGGSSGGHRAGTGVPGKTEFPPDWTDAQLTDVPLDVVRPGPPLEATPRRSKNHMKRDQWAWTYRGVRNGVEVEVIVLDDGVLRTWYPVDPEDSAVNRANPGVRRNPPAPDLADVPAEVRRQLPGGVSPRYTPGPTGSPGTGRWTYSGAKKGQQVTVDVSEDGGQVLPRPDAPPPTRGQCGGTG